jgi:hypothetical protein
MRLVCRASTAIGAMPYAPTLMNSTVIAWALLLRAPRSVKADSFWEKHVCGSSAPLGTTEFDLQYASCCVSNLLSFRGFRDIGNLGPSFKIVRKILLNFGSAWCEAEEAALPCQRMC